MQLYKGYVRNVAHSVKERDIGAYCIMARSLAKYVRENDVLVPAPNHEGYAVYTLKIAKMIQEMTGCGISDSLQVVPHIPLYSDKSQTLKMSLKDKVRQGFNVYFLDNVIATGKTFLSAKELIPELKALPYAYTKSGSIFLSI
jgi:hypothetical protein